MRLRYLILAAIVLLALAGPASAEITNISHSGSANGYFYIPTGGVSGATYIFNYGMAFGDVNQYVGLTNIMIRLSAGQFTLNSPANLSNSGRFGLVKGGTTYGTGTIGYNNNTADGKLYIFLNFDEPVTFTGLTGNQEFQITYLDGSITKYGMFYTANMQGNANTSTFGTYVNPGFWPSVGVGEYYWVKNYDFIHSITNQTVNPTTENVSILRTFNGIGYSSKVIIWDDTFEYYNDSATLRTVPIIASILNKPYYVKIWDPAGAYWEEYTFCEESGDVDAFHIAVRDAATGALIASPSIDVEELSTGATWSYTPADGIQVSDALMPGLLYNISATKTGYFGDWQNVNLIGGCYWPVCYGNSIELRLSPITTPTDPTKTTAAFKVYFQDAAYQGDQPVSGATVSVSHPGYTDLLGTTNAQGFREITVNKTEDYTYTITKTGYYPASGSFNISDPTPILVRMYLAPQGTPTVTTLPAPTTAPTTVNWKTDTTAREDQSWNILGMLYVAGPLLGLLAVLALITNLTDMIVPRRRRR